MANPPIRQLKNKYLIIGKAGENPAFYFMEAQANHHFNLLKLNIPSQSLSKQDCDGTACKVLDKGQWE